MTVQISEADLKTAGVRVPRKNKMSIKEVRRWAIRVLSSVDTPDKDERDRVLRQAIKVNKI